jgi:hypothetical protein
MPAPNLQQACMPRPIVLSFVRDTEPPTRKGPYSAVRFEGEVIRAEPLGPVIARHEHHAWRLYDERYPRLQCDCRTRVQFERLDGTRSEKFGPYDCVTFVDGVAYANHHIFAFVDRSIGDWYCHEDERHWTIMVITPAASTPETESPTRP